MGRLSAFERVSLSEGQSWYRTPAPSAVWLLVAIARRRKIDRVGSYFACVFEGAAMRIFVPGIRPDAARPSGKAVGLTNAKDAR